MLKSFEVAEEECPCEDASEKNCEDCQDLPRGTFKYWDRLRGVE